VTGRAVHSRAVLGLLFAGWASGCDGAANSTSPDAGVKIPEGPGHWEALPAMPGTPRFYVGVAAVGPRIFVVGGFGAGPESKEVTAYDTATGTWEILEPLPTNFQMPNVAAVGGRLFVVGGLDQKAVVEYDATGKTWMSRPEVPVPRGRGQSAVGVWGNKILIAGGVIPGKSANGLNTGVRQHEVLALDTDTLTWETLPDLSLTRGYCMGAVIGDRFWVMGGSSDFVRTDDVTVLDLKTKTWMDQPMLPITLSSAAVSILGGKVYLIGGVATGTGTIGPATLVLDPQALRFDEASVMLTPRFGMGAATVGDRIYVPAGIAASTATMFAPVPTLEVFIPGPG
jgi:N-acetylneuraminic acid mutarotase